VDWILASCCQKGGLIKSLLIACGGAERSGGAAAAADGGFSGSGGSVYVYDMMAVLLMPKKTGKLSALFFGLSLKPVSCGRAS